MSRNYQIEKKKKSKKECRSIASLCLMMRSRSQGLGDGAAVGEPPARRE